MINIEKSNEELLQDLQKLKLEYELLEKKYQKDINELKLSEQAIYRSEENYRTLFESAKDGIFQISIDGNIIGLNNSFAEMHGYTLDELRKMNLNDLDTPDSNKLNSARIQRIISGETMTFEVEHFCKNGQTISLEVSANLVNIGNKKHILGFHRDITKRKQAEAALVESEKRFRSIFENTSVGFYRTALNGEVLLVNQAALDIMGFKSLDEMGNYHIENRGYTNKEDSDTFLDLISKHGVIKGFESQWRKNDNSAVYIRESCWLVKDINGNPLFYEGSFEDITDRKTAEKLLLLKNQQLETQYEQYILLNELLSQTNLDLKSAKNKAEESDKLKTSFLQNMSHEIRTPLNGIIGFSKLLQDDNLSKEEINEFTFVIQQSGKRLIEIVNNVLDVSKIETGQIVINNKSFSINSLINDLYVFFYPLANEKGLILNFHNTLPEEKCIIYSDELKINQILTNLINNSIKFTQTGSIDFGSEFKNNVIQFYVQDTGIGISEQLYEKIFDRFTQVEDTIGRNFEGAGLGLAICKGLVKLLGGEIWLESKINNGTKFIFTLPFSSSDNPVQSFKVNSDISEKLIKCVILIVEDDYVSYKYLKNILKNSGCYLLLAENGEKAVEMVKNTPNISLVLMDIRMPVMGGFEATRLIKLIRPDLPIIAQTAYAFNEEKNLILSCGCDDYLSKPIDVNKLKKIIEKYLK
jgi:PAS domain S-box-containing protein